MPFDWAEYLELAQRLQTDLPDGPAGEAALRTAVSRAYYAAYCRVRNRERDRRSFAPGPSDGQQRGRLHAHLGKTGKRDWSAILRTLQQWRESCDYEDDFDATAVIQHALDQSKRILDSYP